MIEKQSSLSKSETRLVGPGASPGLPLTQSAIRRSAGALARAAQISSACHAERGRGGRHASLSVCHPERGRTPESKDPYPTCTTSAVHSLSHATLHNLQCRLPRPGLKILLSLALLICCSLPAFARNWRIA